MQIFTHLCWICSGELRSETIICKTCLMKVLPDSKTCSLCGESVDRCFKCTVYPPPWLRFCWIYKYNDHFKPVVNQFKQYGNLGLLNCLTEQLLEQLSLLDIDVVTFVPSSPFTWLRNGYSPAKKIASRIAKRLKIPAIPLLKRRIFSQKKNVSLQARVNTRWFTLSDNKRVYSEVSGKSILLVDDIAVSNSSLEECGKLLGKYSKTLFVATIAKKQKED